MITIKSSTTINRPPTEVFDFVVNSQNAQTWLSGLLETRPTSDKEGVGHTWIDVIEMFGRPVETEFELTELEPGRRFAFKSISGSFPISGVYSFTPTGNGDSAGAGTTVTFDLQGEPGGFFKLAQPLLSRMIQRQWDTNVANLKDVMESSQP